MVFGGVQVGNAGSLELNTLDGTNGFVMHGVSEYDYSGYSVSAAGDINNDGVADLIVGAYQASPGGRTQAGSTYVVFGGTQVGNAGSLELNTLDGTNGFVINGVSSNDFSGRSASAAGDINHDGIADLIIGANGADPGGRNGAGSTYVLFGGAQVGNAGSLELSTLDGSNGFVINGGSGVIWSGYSASAAGDINNDGVADLIIGAYETSPGDRTQAGSTYVVFGGAQVGNAGSLELNTLNGSNGFVINGVSIRDSSGYSVSAAGDINNDGIADLIIGAHKADPGGPGGRDAGSTYVVFGRDSTTNTLTVSPTLPETQQLTLAQSLFPTNNPTDSGTTLPETIEETTVLSVLSTEIPTTDRTKMNTLIESQEATTFPPTSVATFSSSLPTSSPTVSATTLSRTARETVSGTSGLTETMGLTGLSTEAWTIERTETETLTDTQRFTTFPLTVVPTFPPTLVETSVPTSNPTASATLPETAEETVSVTSGVTETLPLTAFPTWSVSDEDLPGFKRAHLRIVPGEPLLLSAEHIWAVSKPGLPANDLEIRVEHVLGGDFEKIYSTRTEIVKRFTQAEINAGRIQFVPDDDLDRTPSFDLRVRDAVNKVHSSWIQAEVRLVGAPQAEIKEESLEKGGSQDMAGVLSASGDDHGSRRLLSNTDFAWQVHWIDNAAFEWRNTPGVALMQFNQSAVDAGWVQLVSDGGYDAPRYGISVGNGYLSSAIEAVPVIYTFGSEVAPRITANYLLVLPEEPTPLTTQELAYEKGTSTTVEVLLGGVSGGCFSLATQPDVNQTRFSEAEFLNKEIVFHPDSSGVEPVYWAQILGDTLNSAQEPGRVMDIRESLPAETVTPQSAQASSSTAALAAGLAGGAALLLSGLGFFACRRRHKQGSQHSSENQSEMTTAGQEHQAKQDTGNGLSPFTVT